MPKIPVGGAPRRARDISLGREVAEPVGVGEQVRLQQFDKILSGGTKIAQLFAARQDKKKAETDDLAANEAYLSFVSASRQKESEFDQTKPSESQGMFLRWKKEQDKIYENSSANLTEDQLKKFNAKFAKYGLESNTRIAKREQTLHEKRIKDNYEGSTMAAEATAFDNLANQKLFYENINDARRFKKERSKLDGADEKKIEANDRKFFSNSVKKGITLMSAISYKRAEDWLNTALKNGELTTEDALIVRGNLDKRKTANGDIARLTWAQDTADDLITRYGENRSVIFSAIEKQTSGKNEVVLKKEINNRLKQIKDQTAETQRKFLTQGKAFIDESTNAAEARENILFITASPDAEIKTAKALDSYIKDVFEKPPRKYSDPFALQEAYDLINKNAQGTAVGDEIIENSAQLEVRFKGRLSNPDMKNVLTFQRNNGFLGRNTYNDVLRSFGELTQKTTAEIRDSKSLQTDFNQYLNDLVPLLPPDKTVDPVALRKLGAGVLTRQKEGETPTTQAVFIGLGVDETYKEAQEAGRALQWLPELDDITLPMAKQLLAEENEFRREQGLPAIVETDRILRELFKGQIMRLPHKRKSR